MVAISDKLNELERGLESSYKDYGRRTIQLGHTARKVSSEGGRDWYEVDVKLVGPGQFLDQVSNVEYLLHPTFKPNVVRRDRPQLNLRLKVWGEFTIQATVHFDSGPPINLTRFLSLPG